MSTEIRNPVVMPPLPLVSPATQKEPAVRPNQSRRSIAGTMLAPIVPRDWKMVPMLTLISLALHLTVLGAIGLMVFNTPQLIEDFFTTVTDSEEFSDPIVEHSLFPDDHKSETTLDEPLVQSASSELQDGLKGPINVNFGDGELQVASLSTGLPGVAEIKVGNETSGRMSVQSKREMVERFGGTTASEAAVVAGLQWLAKHQNPDGSWDFEHSNCPTCKGQCSQNGTLKNCRTGATGMALLSFLGAGHTHKSGDYTKEVSRGIEFLKKSGKQGKGNFDLRGNPFGREGMYAHGICTIALCECSAMTRDASVRKTATDAVNFIVAAQNKTTGGWRYKIGDPGDTSVVGWQVMALKSAQTARLEFPRKAFVGAEKYLNWAQRNRG